MEQHISGLKVAIAALTATLTALWGWLGWMIIVWVVFMALDYLSGSWAARNNREWTSERARAGIAHKGGMIFVVAVSAGADWAVGIAVNNIPAIALPMDYTVLICPLVVAWYLITELGSITENAVKLGAKVPPWLLKIFALGKDAVDAAGNKLTGGDRDE